MLFGCPQTWWRDQIAWKLVFGNQIMFCIREKVLLLDINQQNDKPTQKEQCTLFIHLHMSQVIWAPLVSVVYIVC